MKSCKVTLSGADSEIYALGKIEKNAGGFKLFYELDGDKCEAEYNGGEFTQIRRGSFNMTVRFKENAKSECVISEGGLSGALDVFTKKLFIEIKESGITAYINYELGGEEKTLTLTAAEYQEKK